MKVILTYGDLLLFEDLLRDHLGELRFRAEERERWPGDLIEQTEARMKRLRETIKVYEKEDLP